VPVVVDAGIGAPSHAARPWNGRRRGAREHRHCVANDPNGMAVASEGGGSRRAAYEIGLGAVQETASPTSPRRRF